MKTKFYSTLWKGKKHAVVFFTAIFLFVATVKAQTFTIFDPPTEFPAGGAGGADANIVDAPVELGVKFQVTQGGTIDAIRFYKGTSNTGTHVGSLWDNTGTLLSSVTFTGETASGWQSMALPSPVTILPNTTYTISYWGSTGIYAASAGALTNTDLSRPPFVVLGNTTSAADPGNPGNGVYNYSATAATNFPATFVGDASNYWVDASFTTFFPLPVTLVDFNASAGNTDVALTWKTESEHNNRGFVIERSNSGAAGSWYKVNYLDGLGESSTTRNYSYSDKALAPGLYYYRLKQEDFDGNFKYSSVVTATIQGKGLISLYPGNPNPFHGISQIRFDLPVTQKVRLSVFDINGREVKVLVNGQQEAGSHIAPLDDAGLSKQLYIVRLQTESGVLTSRIVVQ